MNNAIKQIATSHFGIKAVRSLAKRGIIIIGLTTIPGEGSLPYASGQTGYQISDNGTGRILAYLELAALAR